jgi:hypothetical protein
MLSTPRIPDWIKDFRHPSYTNIWQLLPDEKKLYGTETLYGDWAGKTLVLLQDFSTRQEIERRIVGGEKNPYRHDPSIKTNRRLEILTSPLRTGIGPLDSGILYGSALVGLLKEGESLSSSLRNRNELSEYTQQVLSWVLAHMPNLKRIACCGNVAWNTAVAANGLPACDWRDHLQSGIPIENDGVQLFALRHPVNRECGIDQQEREWARMRPEKSKRFATESVPSPIPEVANGAIPVVRSKRTRLTNSRMGLRVTVCCPNSTD